MKNGRSPRLLSRILLEQVAIDCPNDLHIELASFKEEQRPYHSNAASHVGAAVLAHVARSGRLDAALR